MRDRLSYANVVATLALIVAFGTGGAWAASQINGKLLKNRSVKGKKLKKNTVTGKEVRESRLGPVPHAALADNALTVGGIPPAGFVQGGGRLTTGRTAAVAGTSPNVVRTFTTPIGEFRLGCGTANADVRYHNTTPGSAEVFRSFVGGDTGTDFDVVPSSGDAGYAATNVTGPELVDTRVAKGDRVAILRTGESRSGTDCRWNWELLVSG